jgi:UPF0716 protein FxsA
MFLRLFLLLTLLPITELVLLLKLSAWTSWPFTIAVVVLTGVVGASLARRQGWQTVARMQEELAAGRVPTDSLLDGILILAAGAALVTPGLLTDATGFLLLIPPVRRWVRAALARRFRQKFTLRGAGPGWRAYGARDEIIDARVVGPTHSEPLRDER